jgi:hypothetical protein
VQVVVGVASPPADQTQEQVKEDAQGDQHNIEGDVCCVGFAVFLLADDRCCR